MSKQILHTNYFVMKYPRTKFHDSLKLLYQKLFEVGETAKYDCTKYKVQSNT